MTIARARSTRMMDAGARKWMQKTAVQNYWRVAAWINLEDLMQDGELCWLVVRRRYDNATPPHLMALFKTTFINHLHDLANNRTLQTELPFAALSELAVAKALDRETFVDVRRPVTEAPDRVKALLVRLLVDPAQLRQPYRHDADGIETTNERLCAIAGLSPVGIDLHSAVRHSLGR